MEEPVEVDPSQIPELFAVVASAPLVEAIEAAKSITWVRDELDLVEQVAGCGKSIVIPDSRVVEGVAALKGDIEGVSRADAASLIRVMVYSPERKRKVRELGGIKALAEILRSGDEVAEERAAAAIWNATFSCKENTDVIVANGGVEKLFEILEEGTTVAKEMACAAIWNMSAEDRSLPERLGDLGAIERMVAIVREKLSERAMGKACLGMGNLLFRCPANVNRFFQCDGVRLAVDLVRESRVPRTLQGALIDLGRVANESSACAEAMLELGVLDAILDVLEDREKCVDVVESNAVYALETLVTKWPAARAALGEETRLCRVIRLLETLENRRMAIMLSHVPVDCFRPVLEPLLNVFCTLSAVPSRSITGPAERISRILVTVTNAFREDFWNIRHILFGSACENNLQASILVARLIPCTSNPPADWVRAGALQAIVHGLHGGSEYCANCLHHLAKEASIPTAATVAASPRLAEAIVRSIRASNEPALLSIPFLCPKAADALIAVDAISAISDTFSTSRVVFEPIQALAASPRAPRAIANSQLVDRLAVSNNWPILSSLSHAAAVRDAIRDRLNLSRLRRQARESIHAFQILAAIESR